MEKKAYEAPEVVSLGSIRELTALTAPCSGSVPEDFSTEDGICEIQNPG